MWMKQSVAVLAAAVATMRDLAHPFAVAGTDLELVDIDRQAAGTRSMAETWHLPLVGPQTPLGGIPR